MQLINQAKLEQLNNLSSDSLEFSADVNGLTMRLRKNVAFSIYRRIAEAGSWKRGSFNPRTKTLQLSFIAKEEIEPRTLYIGLPGSPEYAEVHAYLVEDQYLSFDAKQLDEAVALCPFDLDALVVLAKRLASRNTRAYSSVKEAKRSTRPRFESSRRDDHGFSACEHCHRIRGRNRWAGAY